MLNLIKNPAGTYSFVGNVPLPLAYAKKDGSAITPAEMDTMKHCGPGFVKGIKAVTFTTEAQAWAVAGLIGIKG